ncbi:MAG: glycosyltransferase family 4 protein [Rhodococcus sp. (in: high G+C Gram-positive bacteria)]|nr:glycosyltransferase family 4 protein [Rhodococcus sp. (in: high G+C Gram-positive bacteria)]
MQAVLNSASTVAVVSAATRDRADAHLGEAVKVSRWIVANNGLSFATGGQQTTPAVRVEHLRHSPLRFLTIARLVERKNIQGCLAALRSLRNAGHQNFEYRIAGTGPMADELRRQVIEAELDAQVEFLGYVDDRDIPALYCWADVFLHPQIDLQDGQDFEGFGLSIADAMSFGCLAIAGNGSGPSDFIRHGVTGILVDGQNYADIRATIFAILNDPDPHRVIAAAGQAYVVKELSWDKHVGLVLSAIGGTE